MKTFKDVMAWQKGYELTLRIYRETAVFPKSEEFGLRSQVRRAAVSVISNIAEGFKKYSSRERIHFYKIAESSLEEVKCQTMLAHDLGYLDAQSYGNLTRLQDETGRILFGWITAQK